MRYERSFLILPLYALALASGCKQTKDQAPPAQTAATTSTQSKTPSSAQIQPRSPTSAVVMNASRRWDFDKDKQGAAPDGFATASGIWAVVPGKDSGRDGMVVLQKRAGIEGQFNVLLSTKMEAKDVTLKVRMRAHEGKIDQGGGLVWRAQDVNNYYVVRYNPLEDNYRLYFVREGRRAMIASADVNVDKRAWHTLSVTMKGARITCSLDGKVQLQARDRTFQGSGKVGLWTKADAVTWFDDLEMSGK